ncbi:fasciclin domain-containing protein [Flavobacterium sp. RSB2_4_14]|uniref:fasciclin domain-containing protein n=1 Tax=Flavobacterium sp. RSB2_4_14 TaxID=3447665 RepID=UPI003F410488
MKKLFKKIALVAICISVFSCNDDDNNTAQPTIVDIAAGNQDFSILVDALERTGLDAVLDAPGQYTVFAPTNAAFTAFLATTPYPTINDVPVSALTNILLNHVIGDEIKSMDIQTGYASTLSPINSSANAPTISMFIQLSGSSVIINGGAANSGSTVTTADIDASNGVIHVVGNVIAIPTLVNHVVANPDFETLQTVVTSPAQSAVLNTLLGVTAAAPVTLFAPNNTAFTTALGTGGFANGATDAQVTKVLQYHVTAAGNVRSNQLQNNQVVPMITSPVQNTTVILGGGNVDIRDTASNLSRVFRADIQCSNGVIHGVNRVLQPVL